MGSPLEATWVRATVIVENDWAERGTGFLMGPHVAEDGRIFVVTNKHVLGKTPKDRKDMRTVKIHYNQLLDDGRLCAAEADVELNSSGADSAWREHPDAAIDVAAFEVTQVFHDDPFGTGHVMVWEDLLTTEWLEEFDVSIGDEVLIVGFPMLSTKHPDAVAPVLRSGIIATHIGQRLQDAQPPSTKADKHRDLRGFLVDGGVVPGSSGSPVILRPTFARYMHGEWTVGPPASPPFLLGIIAETHYADIDTGTMKTVSFAGLGLAFDAETLRETVELFYA